MANVILVVPPTAELFTPASLALTCAEAVLAPNSFDVGAPPRDAKSGAAR
jgi:hypothetical protein